MSYFPNLKSGAHFGADHNLYCRNNLQTCRMMFGHNSTPTVVYCRFFVLFLSMLQLNLFLLAIWLRSTYTSKKLAWRVYKPTRCNTHQILRDTYQTHVKTSHTMFWSFGNSNTFRHLANDCQILRHTSNTLWVNLEITAGSIDPLPSPINKSLLPHSLSLRNSLRELHTSHTFWESSCEITMREKYDSSCEHISFESTHTYSQNTSGIHKSSRCSAGIPPSNRQSNNNQVLAEGPKVVWPCSHPDCELDLLSFPLIYFI